MSSVNQALSAIPTGLRDPLLSEYRSMIQNYLEHRWTPSELSGGKFCEIVYTILEGHAQGSYASKPSKQKNFPEACKKLESGSEAIHSFRILIPRVLPGLYDIRNNRGVGHAGGDVDPNLMDANVVVALVKWVLAELVRVFHSLSTSDAQALVDSLAERTIPLIWESGDVKRVLNPAIKLREQVLLFLSTSAKPVKLDSLILWTENKNRNHFLKVMRDLHKSRKINLSGDQKLAEILPPGTVEVEEILQKLA
jgi:hypothetical protein